MDRNEDTKLLNVDPLEGFQIVDYDKATETVVIQVHRYILAHSSDALAARSVKIMSKPGVKRVTFEMRDE